MKKSKILYAIVDRDGRLAETYSERAQVYYLSEHATRNLQPGERVVPVVIVPAVAKARKAGAL